MVQTRTPSAQFVEAVNKSWGNPERVADVGINETFRHEDRFGFDHDGQVQNAKQVGIIVGRTEKDGPDAFIRQFTQFLNEDE